MSVFSSESPMSLSESQSSVEEVPRVRALPTTSTTARRSLKRPREARDAALQSVPKRGTVRFVSDELPFEPPAREAIARPSEQSPWWVSLAPGSEQELQIAFQKEKFAVVSDLLAFALRRAPTAGRAAAVARGTRPTLIVLMGPPGCGKSTLVECLASVWGCAVVRWDETSTTSCSSSAEEWRAVGRYARDFLGFLRRATRTSPLVDSSTQQSVVLVEALPSGDGFEERRGFASALGEALSGARIPTVLIVSHGDSVSDPPSLPSLIRTLGRSLVDRPETAVVSLPAVPPTRNRAVLFHLLHRMGRGPSHSERKRWASSLYSEQRAAVERSVERSFGDLRHSIASLEMELRGSRRVASLGASARDEFLDSLHALGKVLHASTIAPKPFPELAQACDNASMDGPTLLAFFADQYPSRVQEDQDSVVDVHCDAELFSEWRSMLEKGSAGESLALLADDVSTADVLMRNEYRRSEHTGVLVLALSCVAHNSHPRRGEWSAMRRPASMDVASARRDATEWAVSRLVGLGYDLDSPLPFLPSSASLPPTRRVGYGVSVLPFVLNRRPTLLDRVPAMASILESVGGCASLASAARPDVTQYLDADVIEESGEDRHSPAAAEDVDSIDDDDWLAFADFQETAIDKHSAVVDDHHPVQYLSLRAAVSVVALGRLGGGSGWRSFSAQAQRVLDASVGGSWERVAQQRGSDPPRMVVETDDGCV
jgi:energy-coupling factor transporter ATP-binding protein EcfA2